VNRKSGKSIDDPGCSGTDGQAQQPETNTINYAYDPNRNLTWKNVNGIETCYSYDALNRNTAKVYFGGPGVTNGPCQGITALLPTPIVQYTYDTALLGKGQLGQVSAQGVSTTTVPNLHLRNLRI
jgi:hypothetical protein